MRIPTAILALVVITAPSVQAERIKDMASVAGVRSNQLIGYGLVVGLDGTGDQTSQAPFTIQSFRNMLSQLGVQVPEGQQLQLNNVAAVMVTAELPAFAKPGQEIDVTVSSMANADSLRGGTLLMTPMKGADGQTYALAQGNLIVGGFTAGGNDGSSITVNLPSAGRIPNGASVEVAPPDGFGLGNALQLNLHTPDFTTSQRMAASVNEALGPGVAEPIDAASVRVSAPLERSKRVAFVSLLENLEFTPGDAPARVIVNARTGTVVIGKEVRVLPAAITHGSLTVTIREDINVTQPEALGQGETAVTPDSDVEIAEETNPMFVFEPGTSLNDIVQAVNEVGAAPSDVVAILQALKEAGALRAEFIVI